MSIQGAFGQGYSYTYANTYNSNGFSTFEYRIPFSQLHTNTGTPLSIEDMKKIGFDVVVIDNTPENRGRNRIAWSNNGIVDYDKDGNTGANWFTLDDIGEIIFTEEELEIEVNILSRPTAAIYRLPEGSEIVMDGQIDDIWYEVEANAVDKTFVNESPSFVTDPAWKAVWDDDAIYIFVEVNDNEWAPSWITGLDSWRSDKPELYFDVNATLHNGKGAKVSANGYYQVAPDYNQINVGKTTECYFGQGYTCEFANTYNGSGYSVFEYKIPFSSLIDDGGQPLNPNNRQTIGFDVLFNDNIPDGSDQNIAAWSNDGTADYDENGITGHNWNNLDDAGEISFIDQPVAIQSEIIPFSINDILVFPNPASHLVYLKGLTSASTLVLLINSNGEICLKTELKQGQQSLDISSLSKGLYALRLINNSKTCSHMLMIE